MSHALVDRRWPRRIAVAAATMVLVAVTLAPVASGPLAASFGG